MIREGTINQTKNNLQDGHYTKNNLRDGFT